MIYEVFRIIGNQEVHIGEISCSYLATEGCVYKFMDMKAGTKIIVASYPIENHVIKLKG